MEKKRRRRADSGLIEDDKEKSVCFSKRRNGLFRKAKELCSLHPSIVVHAVAFTPAGRPFPFGDPLSLLSDLDLPPSNQQLDYDQISSIITFDASTLGREEAEFQMGRLQNLRSTLLSMIRDQADACSSELVNNESKIVSDFLNDGLVEGYNNLGALNPTDNTNNLEGFVYMSELGVNSQGVCDFAQDLNTSNNLFDFKGLSDVGVDNPEISFKFGGREAVDMNFVSFSELGYESEFEKLRNGYDFAGDNDYFTQQCPS